MYFSPSIEFPHFVLPSVRFAIIYHLSKLSKKKSHFNSQDPLPPPRSDSLPKGDGADGPPEGKKGCLDEVDHRK